MYFPSLTQYLALEFKTIAQQKGSMYYLEGPICTLKFYYFKVVLLEFYALNEKLQFLEYSFWWRNKG